MRFSAVATVVVIQASVWAAVFPVDAHALSFGRVRSAVTLGQPLSVAVPIILDEGEPLLPECVRAEVMHGETMWPGNVLRARITQGTVDATRVVRITSTSVVEEPVLTVTLHVGCPTKFTRSYTLLADPPVALATATVEDSDPVATSASTRRDPTGAASSNDAASRAPTRSRQASASKKPNGNQRPSTVAQRTQRAASDASAASPSKPNETQANKAPVVERARLQLDAGAVSMSRAAVEAAQEQASAAKASALAAELAASAAQTRLLALETEITKLRADSKAQLDAMAKLQVQLAQRDPANSPWLAWLAALALLSSAAALVLGLRLRQARGAQKRDAWWRRDSRDLADDSKLDTVVGVKPSRIPAGDTEIAGPATQTPEQVKAAVATAAAVPITPMSKRADAMETRAVTVDEQIDLEQEADFFIALGHDDAAIDLLLAHLRSTGGAAPMPYLKLLDMYRRRGDRDEYELMRRRFNQRFNSVAPEWDYDASAGRVLEDYPGHIARLQAAWPKPINAIAELEAMAFGRSDDHSVIDLPAYQDVLFLYQLARKLHDDARENEDADVDVLLPLDAGSPGSVQSLASAKEVAMAPLDLDISTDIALVKPYRSDPIGPLPTIDLDLSPPGAKKS